MIPRWVLNIWLAFCLCMLVLTASQISYAGEKEDLRVYALQEHMRALQLDAQITSQELQKATEAKKIVDEAEKKAGAPK